MPMIRETFAFHYATLDGPPTLRMLSVGGDESRDYISRQATLSVKSNGVYTVLGTETFLASILSEVHGSRSENVKLRWKFDYLVSDRKVDATGKTLPGEKTLTPLTFSCSPYLLHPLQGKKTAFMHIVKKNLVSKLGSQKLEPPVCPPSHSAMPPCHASTWRNTSTHARSHSDAAVKRGRHPTTRSPLGVGAKGGTIRGMSQLQYIRRRRASSAGEHSLPIPKEDLVGVSTTLRHPPIGLHIMPSSYIITLSGWTKKGGS
ncbi:hypothetical protein PAXRUDRAFT_828295 [Paxillus rubicundulus Ve08.2h10]|uniref:Uncharacterized protein n=1 Tax=Paxillus rubicundulus Ve08.2h10 TaxID=930991 RepID=A0A0D0E7M4_9AGAM|nr:hypothetical protein PAXRUDRAFT_828295 [Paxillus rubicundulus Ve08.2h10]